MESIQRPGGTCIILRDDVILRDERHYLESGVSFCRDSRKGETLYLSPSAFELLIHLTSASAVDDAWTHYTSRCSVNGEPANREEFDDFVRGLLATGTLEAAGLGKRHTRPLSNLSLPVSGTAPIKPMTFPTRVSVELTRRCNMACLHCLRSSSPGLRRKEELATWEILGLLHELDTNGVTSIALTGGETTLRPDIEAIVEHLRCLRTHVEFFTNGFRLRPALIEKLAETQRAKGQGFHVHLSLDGATPATHDWLRARGSFARATAATRALCEAGVRVVVETCLTPLNLDELQDIVFLCRSSGAETVSIHPISCTGRGGSGTLKLPMAEVYRAADEVARLREEHRDGIDVRFDFRFTPSESDRHLDDFPLPQNTAPAGMFHMAIGADGQVYPCTESTGVPALVMGDIRKETTAEIWRSPRWHLFRGGWTIGQLEGCRGCVFDGRCASQACRCYAAASQGDFFSPFPDCYLNSHSLWRESGGRT
jgi:radical SAM protein with 4Fe4S-binding SPASM domain